jgi:serine/threonine-protein kinase RsbW
VQDDSHILISRQFHSNREELILLPRLLEEARVQCPISDDQFYNLVIALTEAVNNAIVHGNRSDPSKRVYYSVECRPEGFHCVVEDEGEGFEPEEVDDPLSPENLLRDSGRGMFIIRALMRDFHAEHTGHGMRLEFLCSRE